MMLVSKPLEGYNYGRWSRAMSISLSAKNKIGFVNGSVKAPTSSDTKFHIWQRCNDMVLSWILNAIHPDLAGSVIYDEMARKFGKTLKRGFHKEMIPEFFRFDKKLLNTNRDTNPSLFTTLS
ncbi:hypothetical protein ACH5RR_018039 [Cinchona calisaya]|uniref:Retrotransposon Copia-like N-terminal domain-containing protein n=1 Tax=Cinchona calisaya TaxID=153742 RepID=A0ABD2ZKB2_9GENT